MEKGSSIFAVNSTVGTTETIKDWQVRHFILRGNPKPDELADWINEMNSVAERATSASPGFFNSRNENGEVVFGMNDASGVFAAWPGTLGIAAAVKGAGAELIDDFASCIRREWDAVGMKKGYMYMADCMTDPDGRELTEPSGKIPSLSVRFWSRLIPGVQGSEEGVTADGVAMTVKHFPGAEVPEKTALTLIINRAVNVYQTEKQPETYHIPPLKQPM